MGVSIALFDLMFLNVVSVKELEVVWVCDGKIGTPGRRWKWNYKGGGR